MQCTRLLLTQSGHLASLETLQADGLRRYDGSSLASGQPTMRRRDFIPFAGGGAGGVFLVSRAQTGGERPFFALFTWGTPAQRRGLPFWVSFLTGLRENGSGAISI